MTDVLGYTDCKRPNLRWKNLCPITSTLTIDHPRPLVKLPPLSLPTFKCDPLEWSMFWE